MGRYVVLGELGRGAMGVVYRAFDPDLDRRIALKVIAPESGQRPSDLSREARVLAKFEHPNIATIYDVGFWGEHLFIAMELVDGGHLQAWLTQRRTSAEVVSILLQAGWGLHAAHERGVVHRDFKPSNVLVGRDGRARVADFGLARLRCEMQETVSAGDSMRGLVESSREWAGTPGYMAPEVLSGEAQTPRSDLYSYCVAVHKALEGYRVSAGLVRVIVRGLRGDPSTRPASMRALLEEMEQVQTRRARVRAAWFLGGAIVGISGAAALVAIPDSVDCDSEVAAWTERFGDARTQALERSLGDADFAYAEDSARRVVDSLGRFEEAWLAVYARSCAAEQRDELECLEDQRGRLDALWTALERGGGDVVEHALPAVARLPRPQVCTGLALAPRAPLVPADVSARSEVASVRERLRAADALSETGQGSSSLEVARAALRSAESLQHPPLVAEAAFSMGLALEALGESAEAEVELERAATLGWSSGNERVALDAMLHLVWVVGRDRADASAGEVWLSVARATLDRADWSKPVVADYWVAAGSLAASRGRWAEARVAHTRSLEIRREMLGEAHPDTVQSLGNLATVDIEQGDLSSALVRLRVAAKRAESVFGSEHPQALFIHNSLGLALYRSDDVEGALVELERVHRHLQENVAPSHRLVPMVANNLALVYDQMGQEARAKPLYVLALERWQENRGADAPSVATASFNLGLVEAQLGEFPAAVARLEDAVKIWESTFGPDHPRVADGLRGLAEAHRRAGSCEDAVAAAERALDVLSRSTEHSGDRTEMTVLYTLGVSLLCTGAPERADEAVARAAALARRDHGPGPTLRTMLAQRAIMSMGLGRVSAAVGFATEALTMDGAAAQTARLRLVLARAWRDEDPARASKEVGKALEVLPLGDATAEVRAQLQALSDQLRGSDE